MDFIPFCGGGFCSGGIVGCLLVCGRYLWWFGNLCFSISTSKNGSSFVLRSIANFILECRFFSRLCNSLMSSHGHFQSSKYLFHDLVNSLYLRTHSHTHFHAHSHLQSHTHTHTHILSHTYSLSLTHTHTYTLTQIHSHTLTPTHAQTWRYSYHCRKWNRRHKFESWRELFVFPFALMPLGKVWIHLLSSLLWVNSWADCWIL